MLPKNIQSNNPNLIVGRMLCEQISKDKIFTEEDAKTGEWFIEGIFAQGNVKNNNSRVYPTNILDKSIETYIQEKVIPRRALGELSHPECNLFTLNELQDFDVLTTNRGWVNFQKLTLDDEILTYNTETEILEPDTINKIVFEKYSGEAYQLNGKRMNLKVTPNHRWLTKDRYGKTEYLETKEIYDSRQDRHISYNKHRILTNGGEWVGNDPEFIVIKGLSKEEYETKNTWNFKEDVTKDLKIRSDVFVKFLGIWLAEGHCSKEKYDVFITQNGGEKCQLIREMLKEFPIEWKERVTGKKVLFYVSDIRLNNYVSQLGDVYSKFIPHEIKNLSSELLEELIYWFNIGDGRFGNNNGYLKGGVFSVSKRLIEDLHECLIKSGGSGNWQTIITKDDYMFADHLIEAKNKKPLYQLNISTTKGIYFDERMLKIEKINVDENYYACCLQMNKNQNFYMRYNGKAHWTGNSPKINLDKACILVTEMVKKGDDYYGKAKVLHEDCPNGKILRGLLKSGVQVGVSTRGLGSANNGRWQNEDCDMVDSFVLRAVDVVADPSAPDAYVNAISEEKQYILDSSNDRVFELNEETYKLFESQISNLSVRNEDKSEKLYNSILTFLNSLKSNA